MRDLATAPIPTAAASQTTTQPLSMTDDARTQLQLICQDHRQPRAVACPLSPDQLAGIDLNPLAPCDDNGVAMYMDLKATVQRLLR